MSFAQLKEEVLKLSPEEKAEIASLLAETEADEWDQQMIEDAQAGRLDALIAEADASIKAGRTVRMP